MTLSIRRHDEKEKDPEPTSSYVKLKLKPTSIKESVLYTERQWRLVAFLSVRAGINARALHTKLGWLALPTGGSETLGLGVRRH